MPRINTKHSICGGKLVLTETHGFIRELTSYSWMDPLPLTSSIFELLEKLLVEFEFTERSRKVVTIMSIVVH
jgi:hypothetical protein